jgi:glycosyltransferase involved in cell wall biosynthesis
MKACIIGYTFYEIDFRVRRYAESLAAAGHVVDVFALKRKDEKTMTTLKKVNIYHLQERQYDEKGFKSYLLRMLTFCLKVFIELIKKQLRYRYDVIHINNPPDFLVFTAALAKLCGTKIIFDMHENIPELYCAKFNKTYDDYIVKVTMLCEKLSTRFSDFTIVAHDLLRERVIKRDGIEEKRCVGLLNYPSRELFTLDHVLNNNKKDFRIIYAGTISYRHGIDIAINAMGLVRKKNPSIKFDIYGKLNDGRYYWLLKKLIDDFDLNDTVFFHDVVPLEEMRSILAKASIGVVPKRGGVFGAEAFSTKILELMMAGLPVVVSKTKIDEYYFDSSMVMFFEPENHIDLSKCILDLYEDAKKRKSLSENGIKYTEHKNWEFKSKEYINMVEQLVHHKI